MPADPGIDDRRPRGFDSLGETYGFIKSTAVVHQVEHRQAVDNNKVFPNALAYGAHHFYREAHAVVVAAAPLIVALVGACGEKFVNQVAFRAHYLYAVVACFPRQLGAVGEVVDKPQNTFVREFARRKAVDRRLKRGWGNQIGLIAVAASMQDLQRNFAALLMDGVGNGPVVRQLTHIVQHRAARHPYAGRIRSDAAADDKRHAVTRALGIERRQTLRAIGILFQPGMHRAHQHAVFQLGKTKIERGE